MNKALVILALLVVGAVKAAPLPVVWFVYDHAMIQPVETLAKCGPVLAVINPDSGPGSGRDSAYAAAVDKWRKIKSVKLLVYVDLAKWKGSKLLGYKTPADVRDELKDYNRIYGTTANDGVWYDDAHLESSAVQAYFAVATLSSADIANPGEPVPVKHWMRKLPLKICEFEDKWNGPPKTQPGAVWVAFIKQDQISVVLSAAKSAKVSAIGFEDISRHGNGEYQKPPTWWQKLTILNK